MDKLGVMNISISTGIMEDSSVRILFEGFNRAKNDFAVMQQEHKAALLAGSWKALFNWQQSREKAFRALVCILEKMVVRKDADQTTLTKMRASLAELLSEEEVLRKLIVARQLKMQGQFPAMRKGKEALQGYNINKGLIPRPRYFSSRT